MKDLAEKTGYCYYDYNELLDSFEYENLLQVDDRDYQGDTRVLFKSGDLYGYLQFGWGSCSGCDALQACDNLKEVTDLRDDLFGSIQWKTRYDMLKYFKEHDWEGDYSWHADEQKEFIQKAIEILEN